MATRTRARKTEPAPAEQDEQLDQLEQEEIAEQLGEDYVGVTPDPPAPASGGRRKPGPKPGAARRPSKTVLAAVHTELAMPLELAGELWSLRDQCGQVLVAQADPIAAALTRIIARHPDWIAKVQDGGAFMDVVALIAATGPVLAALWSHHGPGAVREQQRRPPQGQGMSGGIEDDYDQFAERRYSAAGV